MVLSHVIRINGKMDQLSSLQETLQLSSITSISPLSQTSDSTLASAAEVRLVNLRLAATSVAEEPVAKLALDEQLQARLKQPTQLEGLNLDIRFLRNFMQIKWKL